MVEDDIKSLAPKALHSALLCGGGAIVGTLTFPTGGNAGHSRGGYEILYPRRSVTIKNGNLHFFTLDAGRGVFEILLPLDQVAGLYEVRSIQETMIPTAEHPLWQELGVSLTWDHPLERTLVLRSTELVRKKGFKYREVVDIPHVMYFPHPLKFPRYAPFLPTSSQVLYVDVEMMTAILRKPATEKSLLRLFKSAPVLHFSDLSPQKVGRLVFVEGAVNFFEPPQFVERGGQPAELVAITSQPYRPGALSDDWTLACIRGEHFVMIRDSVERIARTYHLCGEWREIGRFESEYGVRTHALVLGAAAFIDLQDIEINNDCGDDLIDPRLYDRPVTYYAGLVSGRGGGQIVMGDQYNVVQAGAVGPHSKAENISFQQILDQNGLDFSVLIAELASLREALQRQSTSPAHQEALAQVEGALTAAKRQDTSELEKHLKAAGKWALDVATEVGKTVAAKAIEAALRL